MNDDLQAPRFMPLQAVTVIHLGVSLKGQVQAARLERGGWIYDVEYRQDDEFRRRDFYSDELEDRQ